MIWTKEFWKGAGERAIKTFFEVFAAVLAMSGGSRLIGVDAGVGDVNWQGAASVALVATAISIAFALGNASFTAGEPKHTDVV